MNRALPGSGPAAGWTTEADYVEDDRASEAMLREGHIGQFVRDDADLAAVVGWSPAWSGLSRAVIPSPRDADSLKGFPDAGVI